MTDRFPSIRETAGGLKVVPTPVHPVEDTGFT